jgi:hypothetical protein
MRLAIRCHPCAPVQSEEIEDWLDAAVEKLRDAGAGETRVQLLRLTQRLPSGREVTGWLVEDDRDDDVSVEAEVSPLLRDMRLLGLEPTVLMRTADIAGPVQP